MTPSTLIVKEINERTQFFYIIFLFTSVFFFSFFLLTVAVVCVRGVRLYFAFLFWGGFRGNRAHLCRISPSLCPVGLVQTLAGCHALTDLWIREQRTDFPSPPPPSNKLSDMSAHGCPHLTSLKDAKGTQAYRLIHSYFVCCVSKDARTKKVGTMPPR